MKKLGLSIDDFLSHGFNLRANLASFLEINQQELDNRLKTGLQDLASLHPGGFKNSDASEFYEDKVGDAHLIDLASWHLNSSTYIADTLRLQEKFATGHVLDFGGGIGTHALAASALENVEHVWFVDLNPQNRNFVKQRAKELGVDELISVHRDLDSIVEMVSFDTVICLDVLEHIADPSRQLKIFLKHLKPNAIALFNWYFYKGENNQYPFHFDDPLMIERFFLTLQKDFVEVFHPFLITTRAYKPMKKI